MYVTHSVPLPALPTEPAGGISRPARGLSILHQLGLAARVNLFAVLPVSLLLFGLAAQRNWTTLQHILLVVIVLANCDFALLTTFYHWMWESATLRGWRAHGVLMLLVLPVLGALGALLGRLILNLIGPDIAPRFGALLSINVSAVMVYGISIYSIEDYRRHYGYVLIQLKGSQQRQGEAERARTQAEGTALQALINPHFVFNTLNAIATVVHENQDKAEELTLRLARLLRHVLELRGDTLISLEAELDIARTYLEIEKVRLESRLRYSLEIPDSLLHVPIPGMLLQPLVENAIKHGIRERPEGGSVRVRGSTDSKHCCLEIINDGPGFHSPPGVGHGLQLVRDRLDHVYGTHYELRLERLPLNEETIVTLRFPVTPPQGIVA
jgi:two-component system LytT family sensor kinase